MVGVIETATSSINTFKKILILKEEILLKLKDLGKKYEENTMAIKGNHLKLVDKIFAPNYEAFSGLYPWSKFENTTLTNAQTLEQAIQLDKHFYLPSDILNMTDQSSMAHGLEIRVPFLCNNLTEMANNLPLTYLLKSGKKHLLKKQLDLKGYPSSFINRPKQGFNAPFGRWFKEDFDYYFAFLEDASHPLFTYIPKREIQQLTQIHLSGKRNLGTELWSVKLLADWLKVNF